MKQLSTGLETKPSGRQVTVFTKDDGDWKVASVYYIGDDRKKSEQVQTSSYCSWKFFYRLAAERLRKTRELLSMFFVWAYSDIRTNVLHLGGGL